MRILTLLAALLLSASALVLPTTAEPPILGELLTVEEALALAFPDCEIVRGTIYLSKEQKERASELAKFEVESNIVHPYEAFDDEGTLVGTAYFDTHRVRTKNETVMLVVTPAQRIGRIELCAFGEPMEYVPSGKWYGQFLDRVLDDELNLKRGIRGVTGATLTASATTRCARRVLALHAAIQPPEPEPVPPHREG